jgi:hypothetical protein
VAVALSQPGDTVTATQPKSGVTSSTTISPSTGPTPIAARSPRRVGAARRRALAVGTTPGWLRAVSTLVVIVALAGGIVGLFSALARHNSADSAVRQAAPLVEIGQTVHTALSDADSTIAGAFLAGTVIPPGSQSRYADDVASVASGLTELTSKGGTDPALLSAARSLAVDTPIYAGIVQTAVANNRQGFPVAAAYLSEANNLMRTTMLPAAARLDAAAQNQLNHDNDRATASIPLIATIVLLVATLLGLLLLQVGVTRRFRRLLNLPLVLATVLVVVVGVWAIAATGAEHRAITKGQRQGVAPLSTLAEARTLAFQARGDDELTLVTRDAVATYQQDYASTIARLRAVLAVGPSKNWTPAEQAALTAANAAVDSYELQHQLVRKADSGGDLTVAIRLDRTAAAAAAAQLDQVLGGGISAAATSFDASASSAASDVDGVGWWWLGLMVIAALAVLVGIEPRIREYR